MTKTQDYLLSTEEEALMLELPYRLFFIGLFDRAFKDLDYVVTHDPDDVSSAVKWFLKKGYGVIPFSVVYPFLSFTPSRMEELKIHVSQAHKFCEAYKAGEFDIPDEKLLELPTAKERNEYLQILRLNFAIKNQHRCGSSANLDHAVYKKVLEKSKYYA